MVRPKSEGRVEIAASGDQAGALCALLQGAQHIVRIFSDALEPQLFDHAGLAAELSRVARQGRACEVRILFKDSHALTRHTHRLATLHQRSGEVVSYDELFEVVKSGRNRDNVRKHVSTIREALREVDPSFEGIENVPMRGFRWTGR